MNLNRCGLRRLVLKVHLRNTLDLLRLLLTTIHLHRAGWCGRTNLQLVELSLSVVQVKLEIMKLVHKEVDRSVTIHHCVLKLVNLAMELGDESSPALELGTSLLKLLIPQLDGQVQGLCLVNQLSDHVALESVESV